MKKVKKGSFLSQHPEARGLILLAFSLVLILALVSFNPTSPKDNWLGLIGYGIGLSLTYVFGLCSYILATYVGWVGIGFLSRGKVEHLKSKTIYFGTFIFSLCLLFNLIAEIKAPFPDLLISRVYIESISLSLPYPQILIRRNLGGVPLYYLYRDLPTYNLQHLLSNVGIGITFTITAFVSALLFTDTKLRSLLELSKKGASAVQISFAKWLMTKKQPPEERLERPLQKIIPTPLPEKKQPVKAKVAAPIKAKKRAEALRAQRVSNGEFSYFRLPPATLLRPPKKMDHPTLKKDLRRYAEILEETLLSFGIEAKVGEINCGPTIISFEVHPAIGVKVQKIKALENDIALNLQARSIRIIAPIPGKAAVGVEIPSPFPQEVSFRELLAKYQQLHKKFHIPILLGKTVGGELVMNDLAKMPHCIIAGATGSGKSVCINTIVMSIVMTARPDEIKLLMVDPKKVELSAYSNLPHMIAPVITEAHGAYAALNWLVKEMQQRYEILKQLGLRNITAFNSRKPNKQFEESLSIEIPEQMPKIVGIIDEFADLIMASGSDLETPIARIAQMARAVGIHLILATQRPSREVITGIIKANFPTRISFKVSSRVNSQIILDETGAESLLGNGDMLFLPPGTSQLTRAQGTFISDSEINEVIDFICEQAPPRYLISSFDTMQKDDLALIEQNEEAKDSLYDQAHAIVVETGSASTTFLQRKLKIGYARAASLMDELESKGVVGPQEGARPRKVLLTYSNRNDE